MLKTIASLFIAGLVLGYGPCLLTCGPLLFSYITATKENAFGGFKTYLLFSLTRMVVYFIFGLLAGFLGEMVVHRFFESEVLKIIFFLFGLFLFFTGIFLGIERFSLGQKCRALIHRSFGKNDAKSIIIFGLIVSFSPCLPLIAVLGYIALIADHWAKGLLYMAAFGLGTVISPMIFLSMAAGWIAEVLKRHERVFRVLRIACGLVIAYLGINLMRVVR